MKTLYFLLGICLIFSGCATPEDISSKDYFQQKVDISFDEFLKETQLKSIPTTIKKQISNKYGRSIEEEYLIDTAKIKRYIDSNDRAKFTFKVYPLYEILEENEYYNLVYERLSNNEWNRVIYKISEKLQVNAGDTRIDHVEMIYNDYPNVVFSEICSTSYYVQLCDGSCAAAGYSECDGFSCPNSVCFVEVVDYFWCSSYIQSGSADYLYMAGPGFGGGGGGGTGSPNSQFLPNPVNADCDGSLQCSSLMQYLNFKATLPIPLKNLLDENGELNSKIFQLLTWQNHSGQSKSFVTQLLWEMVENNTLFDPIESFKSPANLDLRDVKPDNPADPLFSTKEKFMCVFNKLIESPSFKHIFLNTFSNDIRLNIKFQIADLPGNSTSGLVGSTVIVGDDPNNNLITIDKDLINSGNTITIAKTILHEFIHAFLNMQLCTGDLQFSIPSVNSLEFYNCINEYYNLFSGNQDQHNFFYNNMIPTMSQILFEVKDSFVSPDQNANLESLTLHIIQNSNPPTVLDVSWNWNDFLENLCLDGLQNCNSFQDEIATFGQNGLPVPGTIIDQLKTSTFMEYKTVSAANLPTSCEP